MQKIVPASKTILSPSGSLLQCVTLHIALSGQSADCLRQARVYHHGSPCKYLTEKLLRINWFRAKF